MGKVKYMLTNKMNIVGVLTPTNLKAVSPYTKSTVQTEFIKHNFSGAMHEALGENGIIEVDYSLATPEVNHSAMGFMNRFQNLIWANGIAELRLEGKLIITGNNWRDTEPVIIQVNIRNGNLYYQNGHTQWETENTLG